MLAPLLQLTADNALLRLEDQASFAGNFVTFMGISSDGPAGVLRAGESGTVQIPFQTTGSVGQNINFNVGIIADSQPIDWASQQAVLQPPTISNAAWSPIFTNFVANVGSTGASYHAALAADATYLGQLGDRVMDIGQLFGFEIEKANGFSPLVAAGQLRRCPGRRTGITA